MTNATQGILSELCYDFRERALLRYVSQLPLVYPRFNSP